MSQLWEVVGGADKGGIVVREARETASLALPERLATGAIIEEVLIAGERLHYKKVSGSGPERGWVTMRLAHKDLVIPTKSPAPSTQGTQSPGAVPVVEASAKSADASAPSETCDMPRNLRPACEIAAPGLLPCPILGPMKVYTSPKKAREAASKRLVGDMYGLPFPQTPEDLSANFGAAWLTKALHAAGTLPKDNTVKRFFDCKRFEGGGSGPKAIFKVEYAKPDDALDTTLFVKFPYTLEENANQRIVESRARFGDNWGGETNFNRFLSPHVPFPVPKFYFADVCRESTEAILINACVPWSEKGKTSFSNFEVFPPCGKCEDYTLTRPEEYYFAIMHRLGTFSGLAKADKLGPEAKKLNWLACNADNDVNAAPNLVGGANARTFVEVIAPHWFSEKVRSKDFLDKFVSKFDDFTYNREWRRIVDFLYGDAKYIGLCHQNGNTDNCFFYRGGDGTVSAGILDWGSTAPMSYASSFMGSTIGALAEMLAEYDERLVRAWADAYHAVGAPRIDVDELLLRYRLSTCISACGVYSSVDSYAGKLETAKASAEKFKDAPAYNCEAIRADFGTKFGMSMLYNRITLFALKGDYYWSALPELLKRSGGR